MGDLLRGRTARSLAYLMKNYSDVRLVFIAPGGFEMEDDIKLHLDEHNIEWYDTDNLAEVLPDLDAIYVTRIQTEWDEPDAPVKVDYSKFQIGMHELDVMRTDAVIMHPLPRGPELHPDVDTDPRAMYWRQERNGMWMRVAALLKTFGVDDQFRSIYQDHNIG